MSGQHSDQPRAAASEAVARHHLWSGWIPATRRFGRRLWSWQTVRKYWSFAAAGLLALGAYADSADALLTIGRWFWPFEHEAASSSAPSDTPPATGSGRQTGQTGQADQADPGGGGGHGDQDGPASGGAAPAEAGSSPGSPDATGPTGPVAEPEEHDPITVPGAPRAMATGDGSVWVATAGEDGVSRVDAATGQVERSEPLGAPPRGLVHAEGSLWVVQDDRTVRLDPETLRPRHGDGDVVGADQVVGRHVAVAGDPRGHVWLVTHAGANARLYRLDPDGDRVEVRYLVNVAGRPAGLVVTDGVAWVVMTDGEVHGLDTATGRGVDAPDVGAPVGGMARHGGHLWLTSPTEGAVYRVRLGGAGPPARIDLAAGPHAGDPPAGDLVTEPGAVVAVGDTVWVVDQTRGTLARINGPGATVAGSFPSLGRHPVALAWTDGVLWTGLADDQAVVRTEIPYAD